MKINFTRIIGLFIASLVLFALRELSSGSSFFPYTRTRTSVPRLLAEGKDTEKVVIRGDVGSSYHATLLTLNTSVPSCAYNNNEIGHVGLAYGYVWFVLYIAPCDNDYCPRINLVNCNELQWQDSSVCHPLEGRPRQLGSEPGVPSTPPCRVLSERFAGVMSVSSLPEN